MFSLKTFTRNVYDQSTLLSGLAQSRRTVGEIVGCYVYPYPPYGPLWRHAYRQLWAER